MGETFECPQCHRVSHNPTDALVGWCGACEEFTRDTPMETMELIERLHRQGQTILAHTVQRRLSGDIFRPVMLHPPPLLRQPAVHRRRGRSLFHRLIIRLERRRR